MTEIQNLQDYIQETENDYNNCIIFMLSAKETSSEAIDNLTNIITKENELVLTDNPNKELTDFIKETRIEQYIKKQTRKRNHVVAFQHPKCQIIRHIGKNKELRLEKARKEYADKIEEIADKTNQALKEYAKKAHPLIYDLFKEKTQTDNELITSCCLYGFLRYGGTLRNENGKIIMNLDHPKEMIRIYYWNCLKYFGEPKKN